MPHALCIHATDTIYCDSSAPSLPTSKRFVKSCFLAKAQTTIVPNSGLNAYSHR